MYFSSKLTCSFYLIATTLCCILPDQLLSQSRIPRSKALIIGISNYQDSTIPPLPIAVRDAQFFASFIKSNYIKLDYREQLLLLTDKQASLAGISAGLDWLVEDAMKGDTLILFFAAYASFLKNVLVNGNGLYFNDSPSQVDISSSFNLFSQFKALAQKKKAVFQCFGNLYPDLFANKEYAPDSILIAPRKKEPGLFKNIIQIDETKHKSDQQIQMETLEAKHSLVSYLIKGMMGLADHNDDRKISFKELESYFNTLAVFPWIQPGILFAASSSAKDILSHVNPKDLHIIEDLDYSFLSPIISIEVSRREQEEIQRLSERNRLLYEDFILAIKLGHLLYDSPNHASSLLDTLAKEPEMQKLLGNMKRNLAAALQDETQQVLNAYLNVDSKELFKRTSGNVRYDIYAQYLEKALQLLSEQHYMVNILKAKKMYFEAVQKRMTGQKNFNMELIHESINILKEALVLEDQAPFLYNELGINYSLYGKMEDAKKSFHTAIEYSPSWSIPFSNLAQLYANDDLSKALRIAKHAVRLAPQNSFAWYIEGTLQLRLHNYQAAETSLISALNIDPSYTVASYNLACTYALINKAEEAFKRLDQSLQSGIITYETVIKDIDLDHLKLDKEKWNALMQKYFPEKIK